MDTEKILVVDDEEAIREVVSTMLQAKGYDCSAVNNGRAEQDVVQRIARSHEDAARRWAARQLLA